MDIFFFLLEMEDEKGDTREEEDDGNVKTKEHEG
jgi:hypothetical protein